MTKAEKLAQVKLLLGTNMAGITDNLINAYLDQTTDTMLNRLYPYGVPTNVTNVPLRYEQLQCKIVVYLVGKNGAEGEKVHNENGIQRSYENGDIPESYLSEITPYAGVW